MALPGVKGLGGGNAVHIEAVPPDAHPSTGVPLLLLELELLLLELELLLELLELLLELELLLLELLELESPVPPPHPSRLITGTATTADPIALTSLRRSSREELT